MQTRLLLGFWACSLRKKQCCWFEKIGGKEEIGCYQFKTWASWFYFFESFYYDTSFNINNASNTSNDVFKLKSPFVFWNT
jgi:hypothetical protein